MGNEKVVINADVLSKIGGTRLASAMTLRAPHGGVRRIAKRAFNF